MKRSFFFVAALALVFASCENTAVPDQFVATFEEATVTPPAADSILLLSESGTIESGNFKFEQEVADYGSWGVYYFGSVVSNKKGRNYAYYADSYKSAAGGAFRGNNYVVWTNSYAGVDRVVLKEAAVVPGMYVCNTTWVVDAILNGDGMSEEAAGKGLPFGDDDYFELVVTGSLNGAKTGEITFDLARGKHYVQNWTYVDLSPLGKVSALKFTLQGSKHNSGGLTTPAYFCIDNFGAKK